MILIPYFTLPILILYLLTQTPKKFVIYSILLILSFIGIVGSTFKIMHWPFAGIMLILGMVGEIIFGFMLSWNAIKNRKDKISFFHLALGVIILFQLLFAFNKAFVLYARWMNYPIVGLSGTILLNRTETNRGERNVLILVFVQGVLFMIKAILRLSVH